MERDRDVGTPLLDHEDPAPPVNIHPVIPGYEHMAAGRGSAQQLSFPVPPVSPSPSVKAALSTVNYNNKSATLDDDQCRQAFITFAKMHRCYGKLCAKEHEIINVETTHALHYMLETFTEMRSTAYVYAVYRGGAVEGPTMGAAPGPWDMEVTPDRLFHDHAKKVPVPFTSVVQSCFACCGRGFDRCSHCGTAGRVVCTRCNGRGHVSTYKEGLEILRTCSHCGGMGRARCMTCSGEGRITCVTCNGYRLLKHFIELTVHYRNHQSDFIYQNQRPHCQTPVPDQLIRSAAGVVLIDQNQPQVSPLTCSIPHINAISVGLVDQHKSAFSGERQIRQHHVLRSVAITEVQFLWMEHTGRYWICGLDRKVYCPKYPQKCCCAIL